MPDWYALHENEVPAPGVSMTGDIPAPATMQVGGDPLVLIADTLYSVRVVGSVERTDTLTFIPRDWIVVVHGRETPES